MHESSRRAIAAAFLANLGIAAAKTLAFAVTGAASLLAEAIHSVADTGNQGLLFLGGRRAAEARRHQQHPFGFGRERYFWSFVVALVLFSLGSVFALVEGVDKLIHPHTIEQPVWAFAVLGVAFVLESAFDPHRDPRGNAPARGDRSWWAFIRETKSPEIPVVLLEDFGALIGLGFALIGVTLSDDHRPGRVRRDRQHRHRPAARRDRDVLAIETKSLLIGEAATPEEQSAIRAVIDGSPEISRLIHLRTEHLGPDDLLVAAKAEFTADVGDELAGAIDTVEARLARAWSRRRGSCTSSRTSTVRVSPTGIRSEPRRPGRDEVSWRHA